MSARRTTLLGIVAAFVLLAAACSSSAKGSTNSPSGGSGGTTYKLGVLVDMTGLASTNDHYFPQGVAAGVGVAGTEGVKVKYVVADTQSSPAGTLAAAKELVEQDHVFAVLALSALTFAAAPYLTSKGIPVIGAAQDATEWLTARNMFSIFGTEDYTKVYSQYGLIYKGLGATNLASIGYSVSPASADAAKGTAVSARLAGLKVGYMNANFPFGSTNVAPAALAIKAAGSDALNASIETNTEFALINALRQEGVNLKVALVSTGYGGDLAAGGPGAEQTAQGLYFPLAYEPAEMQTPATQKLVNALKTYAGVSGVDPGYGQYLGYLSVDLFVQGLKLTGPNPTQAAMINALLGIRSYNGGGLYGSHSIGFALDQRGKVSGADNCYWVVRYLGSTFHLVPGMEPVCGETVPGASISQS
jgi:branched-chain amino acid transport system substrate-binding protein